MVQAGERSRKDAEGSIAESKLYEADRCTVREDELRCGKGDEAQKYGTMGWPPWKQSTEDVSKLEEAFWGAKRTTTCLVMGGSQCSGISTDIRSYAEAYKEGEQKPKVEWAWNMGRGSTIDQLLGDMDLSARDGLGPGLVQRACQRESRRNARSGSAKGNLTISLA